MQLKPGQRIELVSMPDDPNRLPQALAAPCAT